MAQRRRSAHAGLPPERQSERDGGEQHAHEQERRRVEQDRADRQVIEQAAAQLRHGAILGGYAGMEHKHLVFALALVLDETLSAKIT